MDNNDEQFYLTTNHDLVELMHMKNKDLSAFVDSRRKNTLNPGFNIFEESNLPSKIRSKEIGIIFINQFEHLQKVTKGRPTIGHWVAYVNYPSLKFVYYIDTLAYFPSPKVRQYLETSGKRLVTFENAIQSIDSMKCGYYVVDLLSDINNLQRKTDKAVMKELDQYEIVDDGINDKKDVAHNEKKVLDDIISSPDD